MIPTCKGCVYHMARAIEKKHKWRYQHLCGHGAARTNRMCGYGGLGITKGFETKRKTSPLWCPLRKIERSKDHEKNSDY